MENQFNHPESEKHISTTVGVVVLVLIAIIIGLVVWKFKGDADSASNFQVVPASVVKVEKENPAVVEAPVDGATAVQTGDTAPSTAQAPIDFDKELKDLDTASGAADSNDFSDTGLSNANLGL